MKPPIVSALRTFHAHHDLARHFIDTSERKHIEQHRKSLEIGKKSGLKAGLHLRTRTYRKRYAPRMTADVIFYANADISKMYASRTERARARVWIRLRVLCLLLTTTTNILLLSPITFGLCFFNNKIFISIS